MQLFIWFYRENKPKYRLQLLRQKIDMSVFSNFNYTRRWNDVFDMILQLEQTEFSVIISWSKIQHKSSLDSSLY